MLSSSRKRPDVFVLSFCYGFHRRESRGPVAAGNHKQTNDGNHNKPTTETIKNVFLPRRKPLKNQRRKPVLNKNTRNHSIRSKIMNPPATAESIENLATETINNVFLPRRKP